MKLVMMRKAGESGEVAINPERVTHVRSAPGAFTDIYFGEHRVAVQGSFTEVVNRLSGHDDGKGRPDQNWLMHGKPAQL
jgi:hypothetical protein